MATSSSLPPSLPAGSIVPGNSQASGAIVPTNNTGPDVSIDRSGVPTTSVTKTGDLMKNFCDRLEEQKDRENSKRKDAIDKGKWYPIMMGGGAGIGIGIMAGAPAIAGVACGVFLLAYSIQLFKMYKDPMYFQRHTMEATRLGQMPEKMHLPELKHYWVNRPPEEFIKEIKLEIRKAVTEGKMTKEQANEILTKYRPMFDRIEKQATDFKADVNADLTAREKRKHDKRLYNIAPPAA